MSLALSEHLPLIAAAPDGIQKLRGLILELAVRGKLVAQDPKDEPASELLKRIRRERSQLDGAKSRKKIEPPLHTKESPLFALPRSWVWVPFGEIALHNSGKTLDKGRNAGEARDYITTSNLYWGRFELSELKRMLISDDELERCTARKDDLLICEGGEAGRAAVWSFDREVCFQNHVHRARFMGNIDPYFGFRFFEWLNASGEIEHYRKGVGISNISGKALSSIPFTLPPIAEQHRIVAKVDQLMALCDRLESEQNDSAAAHTRLVETLLGTLTQSTDATEFEANWKRIAEHFDTMFTTEASVDALQKCILQLAAMGKLVPQDPNEESADKLLKRIEGEKIRLETEGVLKKSKQLPAVSEGEKTFIAPHGWAWCRLQQAFDVRDGTHDSPKFLTAGIPFLTSKNIYGGKLDLTDLKFISESDHIEFSKRSKVDQNDILFAMIGSIGNPVVVNTDIDFSFKNMALFKYFSKELSSPEFLKIFLSVIATDMKAKAAGGVQSFVALGTIRNQPIALPPLREQRRIVKKVDEIAALCDSLKNQLAESRKQEGCLADTLIQASLKAA